MATTNNNQPAGTVPSDAAVQLFKDILGETYKRVLTILGTMDPSNREELQAVAQQIEQEAAKLDLDMRAWVAVEVPTFYEQGMFEAVKGLNQRGSAVAFTNAFAHFHTEAIEALSKETYNHIAEGMTGITRTADRVIAMATREAILKEMATGDILGKDRRTIANHIAQVLEDEGIVALRDRGGRQWDLNTYGEMLARTMLTRAHNTGTINRMIESGYDLVEVSSHPGSCNLCQPFEGELLSVTGRSAGKRTLDDAMAMGLFHPNCRHTIVPYHEAYLDQAVVWDADLQDYVPYKELRNQRAQTMADALKAHASTLESTGLANVSKLNRYINTGNTAAARKFVDSIPDTDALKPSMQHLVNSMR